MREIFCPFQCCSSRVLPLDGVGTNGQSCSHFEENFYTQIQVGKCIKLFLYMEYKQISV